MTENTANLQNSFGHPIVRNAAALLSCAAILVCGCSVQKQPKVAWNTATMVKPRIPAASAQASAFGALEAPDLEMPLVPPPFVIVHNPPARPHVAAPPQSESENKKVEAPLLAPQLSAEQTANAQQRMNQSVGEAEKNLDKTRGRNLNPTQADVASKVRGFLGDAREAARTGDWDRAQNLARKAQVLSEELVDLL
jgi:hypothetical protein